MRPARYLPLLVCLFLLANPLNLMAAEDVKDPSPSTPPPTEAGSDGAWKELWAGFDWRFRVLGFGVIQDPVESVLNPRNVLQISRYQTELDVRPDLSLKLRNLELSVKPRFRLQWQAWEDGIKDGDQDTDYDFFVNEWLARFKLRDDLFVSYGRENLQWGPSFLTSPSNPFNRDNGKDNPYREVPGLDYARLVWMPARNWSASFIANTDRGQKDFLIDLARDALPSNRLLERIEDRFLRRFERVYALKLDYTGNKNYLSLIPAYSESDVFRLGFYGGWSASEALLVYTEGSFYDWDGAQLLVGGSYTLQLGPTLTVEYYHNEAGFTETVDREDLRELAGLPVSDSLKSILCLIRDVQELSDHSAPGDVLIRQNYLMLQGVDTRIKDRINVILRWIYDMDDTSNRSIAIIEYELGQHAKLFTVGNLLVGDEGTEFGSFRNYSLTMGVEYNF